MCLGFYGIIYAIENTNTVVSEADEATHEQDKLKADIDNLY